MRGWCENVEFYGVSFAVEFYSYFKGFFCCCAVAPKKEQTPKKLSLNVERNIQEVLNHKGNTTGECWNWV